MSQPGVNNELGTKLVANTLANFTGQGLLFSLAFFSSPYIIHHLGEALYGVFVLLTAYVVLFSILELGLNVSLVKYLAEVLSEKRYSDINGYLGTTLTLFCAAAVITALISLSFAHLIVVRLLNVPAVHVQAAVFGLRLASVAFALQFTAQAYASVPVAAHRFDIVNAIDVGTDSIRIIGTVVVIYLGYLLKAVMVVILVTSVLRLVVYAFASRRIIPGLSLLPRFSSHHFHKIFHFSKFLVVGKIASRLVDSCDKILIGHFLPMSFVTFYSVPYALGQKLWILVSNLITVIFPVASELNAQDSRERLRELYWRSSKIAAAVVTFPAVALCLESHDLLTFWIGGDFARHATLVMQLLMVAFMTNTFAHVPHHLSQAIGHPQVSARFACLQVVFNLGFYVVLIPRYGILGAAFGFLITQLVLTPFLLRLGNRLVGVSFSTLAGKAYLPVFAAAAPACLVLLSLRPFVTSLFSLIVVLSLAMTVYCLVGVVVILDSRERSACLALIHKRFSTALVSAEQVTHV